MKTEANNRRTDDARWRAAATAALLLVTGAVMGILVDRMWLAPPEVEATPLTADALVTDLGLSPSDAANVHALLDSLHAEIGMAMQEDPDSLTPLVRDAQRRIEEALPPDVRPAFRDWMRAHHEQMRGRMHGPDRMTGRGSRGH